MKLCLCMGLLALAGTWTPSRAQTERLTLKRENASMLDIILAVENQRAVHYGMPVRNMMYDAISYTKEAKSLELMNRKEGGLKAGKEFSF